jgi:preprotein translocase subunit SecB
MDTPLLLDDYFFPIVNVSANPNISAPENGINFPYEFTTNIKIQKDEKNEKYQLSLELSSESKNNENEQPYSIFLVAIGIFRVHPEWPNPNKLLAVNGASILYSSAREYLITITARGPYGQVMLPPTSFLKPYVEIETEKKNSIKTKKSAKGKVKKPKKTKRVK